MELKEDRFAVSDVIGRPVRDASGRRLGRVFELRGHWEGEGIVVDEVLIGRGALLKRLRGPGARALGVRWESLGEEDGHLVVRGS